MNIFKFKEDENATFKGELIGKRNEIVTAMARFYNNENMSDVLLKFGTKTFFAHRFVLVLMSDVFTTMCSKRWDSTKMNEIELSESEQCLPVFPLFLQFLYHGQVFVNTSTALPLLMLADKYNVQPLKTSCEDYVQRQVKSGNVIGAIRWLPYLQLCCHEDLEGACIDVIMLEMEYVLNCDDFLLLNIDLLTLLFAKSDLVVSCEYSLYEGMVRWLAQVEENDPTFETHLKSLISLIRCTMMFPEQLLAIENSAFYLRHRVIMNPYLSLAHRFRSLAPEIAEENFSDSLYRPRNYTNAMWCQLISLDADNVSFFNKCINLQCTSDLLTSSAVSGEPTWQVRILHGGGDAREEPQTSSSGLLSLSEGSMWHAHLPRIGVFQNKSQLSIPLQISVRPLKTLRSDMIVDISLFLVRKDTICKHLDTKSITSATPSLGQSPRRGQNRKGAGFCGCQRERVFQPSPMHFTFNPPPTEPQIILEHTFARDELDSPVEVPCVNFGHNLVPPPRPIHTIHLALVIKPRFKSVNDLEAISAEDSCCSNEESLPVLG